ncbi:MAG: signal peptide peptidase SppA [Armatimonadetes bacterium]|nr:signal peptide peptidase SppA [Armatimonadota bacterium]MCX7968110.1 signal peptide peptidase SppA [Armatimonadota bacterium]MDW8143228.1 signal peptide peptidase SppA [Armatimonadota bacterium]
MERQRWRSCLGCLGLVVIASIVAWGFLAFRSFSLVGIAVLPVEGILDSGESESTLMMDVTGARTVSQLLRQSARDPRIKALVVFVDSPGGSAAAAQEIFHSIRRFKERTGKPVIAAMGDVAASGGYYVACAADKIYALPSTLTGSIGVIWQSVNVERLLSNLGIKPETLKAGRFKDTGSFFRSMTPQERELLQQMLNDVHNQFIADVAKGRNLPVEKVREIADGRILTGRQAKALGLVDELGSLDDAIRDARRQVNLPETTPVWVLERKRGLIDLLLGTKAIVPFPKSLLTKPLLLHVDGRLGIGISALLWQGAINLKH